MDDYEDPEVLAFLSRFTDDQIVSGEAARIMEEEAAKREAQRIAAAQPKPPEKKEIRFSNPNNEPKSKPVFAFKRIPISTPSPKQQPSVAVRSPTVTTANRVPTQQPQQLKSQATIAASILRILPPCANSIKKIKTEDKKDPVAVFIKQEKLSSPSPPPRNRDTKIPDQESVAADDILNAGLGEDPRLGSLWKEVMGDEDDDELDQDQVEILTASEEGFNIFITGEAGTGKSRTIKAIVKRLRRSGKVVYQVAPTGVAAANISGMTVHCYAGISGSDRPPYSCKPLEARQRMMETDTLIIDEISMVDNHMLPGLDLLFRQTRNKMNQPFGGIQVIAVGDFAQLKPVDAKKKRAAEEMAKIEARKSYGPSESGVTWGGNKKKEYMKFKDIITDPDQDITYCYHSKAWRHVCHKFFILDRIYRQSDPKFLRLLNEIRQGQLSRDAIELLESRRLCHVQGIRLSDGSLPTDYTVLYSRRADVDNYNTKMLNSIQSDLGYTYKALDRVLIDKLAFLINQFPVPESIWIKAGARVMLKKNITRTMVNGLRGTVIGFSEVFVKQRSSPLFRPIEGCILSGATRDMTDNPLRRDYKVPTTGGESVGIPSNCKITSFCPRKILDTIPLPGSKKDGADLGETDPDLWDYELVSAQRIAALRASGFYPLPVVHFENGEVVTMIPIEWCIEDQKKISKKRKAELAKALGPDAATSTESSSPDRVKLASRVQVQFFNFLPN